jgi:WXG100 family type VII secretion target
MADEIKADYSQLQQVSAQFNKNASTMSQMQQQVKGKMSSLQGSWMGKGSEAFFSEMSDKVLPGVDRLIKALQEASKVTKQMAQVLQQAEQDAAAPFKTDVE